MLWLVDQGHPCPAFDAGWSPRRVRLDATPDTRRQAFQEAFGHYPPHHEATASEREQFVREVVQPVLTQRAQEVQEATSGSVDQATREANEAFARAYQVAVDMGLAEKGQTYQDYLDHPR